LPVDPLGSGLCADRCFEDYHSNAIAASYTHNITPTTVFGFNASVSRFTYNRSPKNAGFDLTTIGCRRVTTVLFPPRCELHRRHA
jgi:hypothetical protein